MKYLKAATLSVGMAALFGSASVEAQQVPGPHPAYIHALSDLRAARHFLNDGWAWEPVRAEDTRDLHEPTVRLTPPSTG